MTQPLDPAGSNDLDRLLRSWAAGQEASAEDLAALKQRILSEAGPSEGSAPESPVPKIKGLPAGALGDPAAHNGQAPGPVSVPFAPLSMDGRTPAAQRRDVRPTAGRVSRLGGPAWFLLGAASVLLAFAASYFLAGDRSAKVATVEQIAPTANGSATGLAALPKDQLLAKARLFAEMRAVFGGQLQWLAETTDHIELGLAGESAPSEKTATLMVKVVVERRAAGASDWQPVWATDVIAPDQGSVVLRPTEDALPATLSLWAYRLPDGMVFVESDLTLPWAQAAVHSASSSILPDNRATEVDAIESAGAEYRVWQTAAVLDGDLG